MDGMDPALRAAYTPMSDTRFEDLMPATWNNNGFSQGTGSAAFLKGGNWGIYEGRLAVGIMGIAFGDTPEGSQDRHDQHHAGWLGHQWHHADAIGLLGEIPRLSHGARQRALRGH